MDKSRVVVVIPNYNLKKDLSECIQSLLGSEFTDFQIIVVDNGSGDGSVEHVKTEYPSVGVLQLKDNPGYAAALNAGILATKAYHPEYILAINNDVIVPADVLGRLVQLMDANPAIGISAPLIVLHDNPARTQSLGDRSYAWLPVPIRFGVKGHDREAIHRVMTFDYIFGCAMFIRTAVFRSIGLFDASYFMQYEDADFCRRARDKGWQIVRDGTIKIRHKVSLSIKQQKLQMVFYRARNRSRFYRRYKHGPSKILTYVTLIFGSLYQTISWVFAGKFRLIKHYWVGVVRGLTEIIPEPGGILYGQE